MANPTGPDASKTDNSNNNSVDQGASRSTASPLVKRDFGPTDILRDRHTAFRYSAVVGLQMGQVFPASFIAVFLPIIFREQGLALSMYWVFTVPAIPTFLRPLWAPLVDRTGSKTFGMRRSWFIPCTLFGAATYASLTLFEPTLDNLTIIITLLVIKTTFMTTQDIAIDGYMVENIRDEERPTAAALLDIARNLARFIAWAAIAWIYTEFGWTAALLSASAMLIGFSTPGIVRQEPPRPPQTAAANPGLLTMLKRPDSHLVFPLCFFIALVGAMIPSLYPTFVSDQGFSLAEVAIILAAATVLGAVAGGIAASACIRRFGYKPTILVASVFVLISASSLAWLATHPEPTMALIFQITLIAIALPSFFDVSFQAARLKWASKSQAATDYTSQIVTMAIAAALSLAIGGFLAEHLGWFWFFILAGSLISFACFVLYSLFDRVELLVEKRDAELLATAQSTKDS